MAAEIENYLDRLNEAGYRTCAKSLGRYTDRLREMGEIPDILPPLPLRRLGEDRQLELFQPYAPIEYRYEDHDAGKFVKIIKEFERYEGGEEVVYSAERSTVTLTPRFAHEIRHRFGGRLSYKTPISDAIDLVQQEFGLQGAEKGQFYALGSNLKRRRELYNRYSDLFEDFIPPVTIGDLRGSSLSDLIKIRNIGARGAVFLTAAFARLEPSSLHGKTGKR